jgi:hypothetical protein
MQVQLPYGIASISGKIGNTVFYYRNGKQYARRLNRHTALPLAPDSGECRSILEALSVHCRE